MKSLINHSSYLSLLLASVMLLGCEAQTSSAGSSSSPQEHVEANANEFAQAKQEQQQYYQNQSVTDETSSVPTSHHSESSEPPSTIHPLGECRYVSDIFHPPPYKTVTLTFDDGPTHALTPIVLQILKKYNLRATFFVRGDNAHLNMDRVQQIVNAGHLVGNHSWDHPNFHAISEAKQISEFTTTDSLLKNFLGPMKLFRYPYGNSTCSTNAMVEQSNYRGIVGWHIDSCDWAYAASGSLSDKEMEMCEVDAQDRADLVGHVLHAVDKKNGGIILLHEIHEHTVRSIEDIIVGLKDKGYKFVNLDHPEMDVYFRK